jgi:hypothetical protein
MRKAARDMRQVFATDPYGANRVGNWYKPAMPVMLICPRCDGETELRGTLDAWYITWCPSCERLWRLELWSLVHAAESESKLPAIARDRRDEARPKRSET